jgi:hypothetical protein
MARANRNQDSNPLSQDASPEKKKITVSPVQILFLFLTLLTVVAVVFGQTLYTNVKARSEEAKTTIYLEQSRKTVEADKKLQEKSVSMSKELVASATRWASQDQSRSKELESYKAELKASYDKQLRSSSSHEETDYDRYLAGKGE